MRAQRAALLVALAGVLACGAPATGGAPAAQTTMSTPTTTAARPAPTGPAVVTRETPPGSSAVPTAASTTFASPSIPPGEAWVIAKVVDGASLDPIRGATVRIDAYQKVARTDADGMVEFPHLPVRGSCRWVAIVVSAPGYGDLQVIDQPLYPLRVTFDFRLAAHEQRSFIGAPSGSTGGESLCSR